MLLFIIIALFVNEKKTFFAFSNDGIFFLVYFFFFFLPFLFFSHLQLVNLPFLCFLLYR